MRVFSCADAIARVIEQRLCDEPPAELTNEEQLQAIATNMPQTAVKKRASATIVGVCPDCGSALRHEEGCVKCQACGYSKC